MWSTLFPILLIACLGAGPGLAAQTDEQPGGHKDPAKPKEPAAKLQQLLEERLATTVELEKQLTVRVKNREGTFEELIEAHRLAHEAALELCDSEKARMAVLENSLAKAKNTEISALQLAKTGQGRESTALKAKAERLRIEIALERAKTTRNMPQKSTGTNGEPPAKVRPEQPRNEIQRKSTTQPATIQSYESVCLFAHVSGVLKTQTVDIGDRVKRGQVLGVVDAADLEAQLMHDRAALDQARARVQEAKAQVAGAQADVETATLAVKQAEETVKGAAASVRYRVQQLKRMEDLFKINSIEEKLLDESRDRLAAARGGEESAKAAVATAKAHALAEMTKIEQAEAKLATAKARVSMAQAILEKAQIQLSYTTIRAPFDGVIVQRGYFPGDFIRAADRRDNDAPLCTIQRMDRLRVLVSVFERDVPFVNVGAAADLEIDALAGKKWSAKVSRMAVSLDPKTRSMTVEIDVANPTGQIRPGMYGKATIVFETPKE